MPDQQPPAPHSPLAECEARLFEVLRRVTARRSETLAAIRDYANEERRRIQGGGTTTAGALPYDSALHTAQARLKEYMRDLPPLTVQRACDDLGSLSLDALERVLWNLHDKPAAARTAAKLKTPVGVGMQLHTADALIRKYIVEHAPRHTVTVRELAKEIRCSRGLVSKCPAWRAYMKLRQENRLPRAVGLTDKLLETTPATRKYDATGAAEPADEMDKKEALERLIREQDADSRADRNRRFTPRRKP